MKKQLGCFVLVLICAASLTLGGCGQSLNENFSEALEEAGYRVNSVSVSDPKTKINGKQVELSIENETLSKDDYEAIQEIANSVYKKENNFSVLLSIAYDNGKENYSYLDEVYGMTPEEAKENQGKPKAGKQKEFDSKSGSENAGIGAKEGSGLGKYAYEGSQGEAQKETQTHTTQEPKEETSFWGRSQKSVLDAVASRMSKLELDGEIGVYKTTNEYGDLYIPTVNGTPTQNSLSFTANTANGVDEPTVLCLDIGDSDSNTGFTAAACCLIQEATGKEWSETFEEFMALFIGATTAPGESYTDTFGGQELRMISDGSNVIFKITAP